MTEKNIEKEYEKLAAKYNLPSFNKMDKEFEIACIEDDKHLMVSVRRQVAEKVEDLANIVEAIVHPENNASGLYESRAFSDNEKSQIFDTFKSLRSLLRASHVAALKNDEEACAEFVRKAWDEWPKIKERLVPVMQRLENSWKELSDKGEKLGYFG